MFYIHVLLGKVSSEDHIILSVSSCRGLHLKQSIA